MQLAQDDSKGKDSIDAQSNSELEGDEFRISDVPFPLHSITFKIDADVDITLLALCDMV